MYSTRLYNAKMGFVTLLERSRQTSLPAIIPLAVSIRFELSGPSAPGNRLLFRAAFLRATLAVFMFTKIGSVMNPPRTARAGPDPPTFHSLVTGSQTLFAYVSCI